MGIKLISPIGFPTYIAETSDIVDGRIDGASIIGGTIYFTDTLTWKIVSGNLQLVDFKLPANFTALPEAHSQNVSTNEDTQKAITLTGAEADTLGLTYIITKQPEHGTLTGTLPALTYTPDANYFGSDSFEYVVNDGMSNSKPATISITVVAVNDPPVAESQSVETDEDVPVNITLVATDVEGDELTYTITTQPSHGTLSGTAPNLLYTPTVNYHGTDSFEFKVNDGELDSNIATVSLTIVSVNDPTVANDQIVNVLPNGSQAFVLDYSDVETQTLDFEMTVEPAHGTLSGTQPNLTYTPESNYHGTDSIEYTVTDEEGASDSAVVTINVNTKPVATSQPSVSATSGVAKNITLAGTDADGDDLTFNVVSEPEHGALTGTAPNIVYTSNEGYAGTDSFTFKVNDGYVDSEVATVSITVSAP